MSYFVKGTIPYITLSVNPIVFHFLSQKIFLLILQYLWLHSTIPFLLSNKKYHYRPSIHLSHQIYRIVSYRIVSRRMEVSYRTVSRRMIILYPIISKKAKYFIIETQFLLFSFRIYSTCQWNLLYFSFLSVISCTALDPFTPSSASATPLITSAVMFFLFFSRNNFPLCISLHPSLTVLKAFFFYIYLPIVFLLVVLAIRFLFAVPLFVVLLFAYFLLLILTPILHRNSLILHHDCLISSILSRLVYLL